MKPILIVEDEYPISQVLRAYLQKAKFDTEQVYTGEDALARFDEIKPSLVLLDIMLPGKNGWQILKEIRKKSNCPVIMLTALGEVNDRLTGLNEGADDYISKPFAGDEVVARVKAVLRRTEAKQPSVQRFGQLEIDLDAHRVKLNEQNIELRPRDLSLLLFLAEHPNKTFTREQLIEHVWGFDYEGSDRAVDLSIKRLRKALKDWPASEGEIRTLRGLGYQLSVYEE
ncbi:DNA-binding response regulator, OmpR family, contains REC and winged-helix (wHTH) domain [Salinibacillus kushneri]|uniref:DNA-binding response regulator, OmpR family, contains REC and winged-helix (WHTH) domain n=1 Tax=Salinibacillus kushneri TaxID=237682 RepID=A0A1I0CGV4_9BACI|nr:response regulator transcription factor [Salinibacillus kushneri]SET18336.1 DNA-binding response regulator, OmpR family, contains REC and winged-helix (wHTH) domain [Salinibacillus kushneri]